MHNFSVLVVFLFFALTSIPLEAAQNALHVVNAQRTSLGLYPFHPDPILQQHAEAEVSAMAAQGVFRGHLGGRWKGPRPGRMEGVGYRSLNSDPHGYRFMTCYQAARGPRYAGAATAVSRGKRFYILILR